MAQPTSRKRKADSSPARSGNDVDPSAGSAPESKPNNTKGKAKAKAKGKSKEAIELKETEKKGKSIVVLLQKAAQIIDRITGKLTSSLLNGCGPSPCCRTLARFSAS